MTTSFKNRLAFNFTASTALLTAVIFLVIYFVVDFTVNNRIEKDIRSEANHHFYEVGVQNGKPYIADKIEWLEREHQEQELNPVFVELTDAGGNVLEKSPNLRENILKPDFSKTGPYFCHAKLLGQSIAQVQIALKEKDAVAGYLLVAIAMDESEQVLFTLKTVLLVAFPIVLVVLFFVTRLIAGRSIQPVLSVIETASKITNENLTARVPLPPGRDELKKLVVTINDLMDRIEHSIDREKQFTSDASHELRTPLAIIKGTLEVLIRKPRTSAEYVAKVSYCVSEIDRISGLVDQLLLLARFESQRKALDRQKVDLSELTGIILQRQQQDILEKHLSVDFEADETHDVYSDPYMLDIVIENLISNAIKYSHADQRICVRIEKKGSEIQYTVRDKGIGIGTDDLEKIQEPFYRADPLLHPEIKGNGLGLSIVKRMCQLLKVDFKIESELGMGTTATLAF